MQNLSKSINLQYQKIYTGWWFRTFSLFFHIYIYTYIYIYWDVIIPINVHIFQRGRSTTNHLPGPVLLVRAQHRAVASVAAVAAVAAVARLARRAAGAGHSRERWGGGWFHGDLMAVQSLFHDDSIDFMVIYIEVI